MKINVKKTQVNFNGNEDYVVESLEDIIKEIDKSKPFLQEGRLNTDRDILKQPILTGHRISIGALAFLTTDKTRLVASILPDELQNGYENINVTKGSELTLVTISAVYGTNTQLLNFSNRDIGYIEGNTRYCYKPKYECLFGYEEEPNKYIDYFKSLGYSIQVEVTDFTICKQTGGLMLLTSGDRITLANNNQMVFSRKEVVSKLTAIRVSKSESLESKYIQVCSKVSEKVMLRALNDCYAKKYKDCNSITVDYMYNAKYYIADLDVLALDAIKLVKKGTDSFFNKTGEYIGISLEALCEYKGIVGLAKTTLYSQMSTITPCIVYHEKELRNKFICTCEIQEINNGYKIGGAIHKLFLNRGTMLPDFKTKYI